MKNQTKQLIMSKKRKALSYKQNKKTFKKIKKINLFYLSKKLRKILTITNNLKIKDTKILMF